MSVAGSVMAEAASRAMQQEGRRALMRWTLSFRRHYWRARVSPKKEALDRLGMPSGDRQRRVERAVVVVRSPWRCETAAVADVDGLAAVGRLLEAVSWGAAWRD